MDLQKQLQDVISAVNKVREKKKEIDRKAVEFGRDVAVSTLRAVPRAGVSAYLSATEQQKVTPGVGDNPISKAEKILLGTDPIYDIEGTGRETIKGFGGSEVTAQQYGLPVGVALTALDLSVPKPGKKQAVQVAQKGVRNAVRADDAAQKGVRL